MKPLTYTKLSPIALLRNCRRVLALSVFLTRLNKSNIGKASILQSGTLELLVRNIKFTSPHAFNFRRSRFRGIAVHALSSNVGRLGFTGGLKDLTLVSTFVNRTINSFLLLVGRNVFKRLHG